MRGSGWSDGHLDVALGAEELRRRSAGRRQLTRRDGDTTRELRATNVDRTPEIAAREHLRDLPADVRGLTAEDVYG